MAAAQINAGDTAWLLISTALVMLMTPGLAFFYGGMAGYRNVLGVIMQSFFILCLISVQWVLWGYSLAFGPDVAGVLGGLKYIGLAGVGQDPNGSIPHLLFMMFQGMFAIITVALITGAFAERMRFSAFVLFSLLWATLIYDPLAHWAWGGGWLQQLGALDFAGGTVVHISSGISALVAALVIGRRLAYPARVSPPHSLPLTILGTGLLWFGWFGFNAGSALTSGGLAASALVVTNTAAAAAALAWTFTEWFHRGKPTLLGAASGAVAGLVAITPASGYVTVPASVIIGAVGGLCCYLAVNVLKPRLGYDDSLDVFGVHGVGGTWGAVATGLFASKAVNPAGADGFLYGNAAQMVPQLVSILATWAFAGIGTFIILKLVNLVCRLRVSEDDEMLGLDLSQHGESAYNFIPVAGGAAGAVGMAGVSGPVGAAATTGVYGMTGSLAAGSLNAGGLVGAPSIPVAGHPGHPGPGGAGQSRRGG